MASKSFISVFLVDYVCCTFFASCGWDCTAAFAHLIIICSLIFMHEGEISVHFITGWCSMILHNIYDTSGFGFFFSLGFSSLVTILHP
jgi:hypothetical protein